MQLFKLIARTEGLSSPEWEHSFHMASREMAQIYAKKLLRTAPFSTCQLWDVSNDWHVATYEVLRTTEVSEVA